MAFDRNQGEPSLALDEIQGDVLVGLQKDVELFVGFDINRAKLAEFKLFLRTFLAEQVTTTRKALQQEAQVKALQHDRLAPRLPILSVNVAFSFKGLTGLNIPALERIKDTSFKAGLVAKSSDLGDPIDAASEGAPRNWKLGGTNKEVDGLLLLTGPTQATVEQLFAQISLRAGAAWTVVYKELGAVRALDRGHEHFGFLDGVSQPGIRGEINQPFPPQKFLQPSQNPSDPAQALPGSDLIWPGEFVFGYPEQKGLDPNHPDADTEGPGADADGGLPWMANGSFLVFRQLKQMVPEFNALVAQQANALNMDEELLGARMIGRWKSGAPLLITPLQDDRELADDELKRNDFEFKEDPAGRKCPFAAHIRKAYPRDDITPAGAAATSDFERRERSETNTQTHRILRRGIPFGPELQHDELEVDDGSQATTKHDRGLMFVSYQTSLTGQFEFIQQAWFNNPDFAPAGNHPGFDPILGQFGNDPLLGRVTPAGVRGPRPFEGALPNFPTGPRAPNPGIQLPTDFVVPTGGGYFFVPSISTLRNVLGE